MFAVFTQLPELPQQPDKKTKHGNGNLQRTNKEIWCRHQI